VGQGRKTVSGPREKTASLRNLSSFYKWSDTNGLHTTLGCWLFLVVINDIAQVRARADPFPISLHNIVERDGSLGTQQNPSRETGYPQRFVLRIRIRG
jgi:hypothetical protein